MPADLTNSPLEHRATPLAMQLQARIRRDGPISVDAYMAACLHDPDLGYYRTRSAIGRGGDFITAPEISQVFGELIGLWCAVVWQQIGAPSEVTLVELGPGRGTLMQDVLRTRRLVPGFGKAMQVVLVETNPVLIAAQRSTLAQSDASIRWTNDLGSAARMAGARPVILIANEVLDTLPIAQRVLTNGHWHERHVGLDAAGQLAFVVGPPCAPPDTVTDPSEGTIAEHIVDLAPALWPGAAVATLYIDYGHGRTSAGDTLQAVRGHAYEHPLTSPGEADLSAQVDFQRVVTVARNAGFAIDGPVSQSAFLGALGAMERASRLIAANPAKANAIEMGVARLMAPQGMGTRFQVLGLRAPSFPRLPGF